MEIGNKYLIPGNFFQSQNLFSNCRRLGFLRQDRCDTAKNSGKKKIPDGQIHLPKSGIAFCRDANGSCKKQKNGSPGGDNHQSTFTLKNCLFHSFQPQNWHIMAFDQLKCDFSKTGHLWVIFHHNGEYSGMFSALKAPENNRTHTTVLLNHLYCSLLRYDICRIDKVYCRWITGTF